MLQTLNVRNLAIVERVCAHFAPGLNIITGETGAGKSILVGALGLVLGERADKSLIRAGADRCSVEATFRLSEPRPVNALLEELALPPCEDDLLIVRRQVSASGSGRNLVNDAQTTLNGLKRLGDLLVDMHGPHDHQSLLSPAYQLSLLDAFGSLAAERETYGEHYRRLREAQAALGALEGDDGQIAEKMERLAYQVREIEAAQLDETDEEELRTEHAQAAAAREILQAADDVTRGLTEGDGAAFRRLAETQRTLEPVAESWPPAAGWIEEAASLALQVQELSNAVGGAAQSVEADPDRLQWLEDRLAAVHALKKKYGGSVRAVLAFLDEARGELEKLRGRGEEAAAARARLKAARAEARKAGEALSGRRRAAAAELAAAITAELRSLGFRHGAFDVSIDSAEPGPTGLDEVGFGFAPNAGEPMRPLRAVASSGEISRVMLASKAVLAAHDRIPVLVFDEIDTNVGGEMGQAMGAKLRQVAAHHQVLCITHLPQVAVHGLTHYAVVKEVHDGRTHTDIRVLDERERVEEVARMLGGPDLTSVTLRHAEEMLART